jgi:hypothetical protein
MNTGDPRTSFVLLRDFHPAGPHDGIDDLRRQLSNVPEFSDVELLRQGASTMVVSLPARNQRQKERLRHLLDDRLFGWRVIEEQAYRLPATF